jgi:hypothetical protein
VLGVVVVPELVGVGVVVVVLGEVAVVPVGVAGATEPADPVLVEGVVGAASVPVPAVSEPHPNNESARTAQA